MTWENFWIIPDFPGSFPACHTPRRDRDSPFRESRDREWDREPEDDYVDDEGERMDGRELRRPAGCKVCDPCLREQLEARVKAQIGDVTMEAGILLIANTIRDSAQSPTGMRAVFSSEFRCARWAA